MLQALLHRPHPNLEGRARLVILGVGSDLRGDDAAGSEVAKQLKAQAARLPEAVHIIDAGEAPEAFTGVIRRIHPAFVLVVDSAEMGEAPGTIRLVDIHQIDGMSASTHTFPLSLFARFLIAELHCEMYFLGIQPADNRLGERLSPEAEAAVRAIVHTLL